MFDETMLLATADQSDQEIGACVRGRKLAISLYHLLMS